LLTFEFQLLTYVLHRYVLHSKKNFLATWHKNWYHALIAPYPLSAHYDHPLAYLVMKFIPTYAPAIVFRFHMLTYLLYLLLISIEETFAYSGYTVMPTNFFLGGIARRMDMHSLMRPRGNFGPWGIMDWMCGTTVGDQTSEDERADEAERLARQAYDKRTKIAGQGNSNKAPKRR
jgi:hypothetical protein